MNRDEEKRLLGEAIFEGLNNKYQRLLESIDRDVTPSEKHLKAMEKILGTRIKRTGQRRRFSAPARIAAAIIAAIIVLTGCTVAIFFDEIKDTIVEFYETYIKIGYDDEQDANSTDVINETYYLSYIPIGYTKTEEISRGILIKYRWDSADGNWIMFKQGTVKGTNSSLDVEVGEYEIVNVGIYELNYRKSEGTHQYVWNDGKYSLALNSSVKFSDSELKLIIDGIRVKK